ncbi:hypothetical protein [Frankia sp. AgB32]|nr:hypothetical protein [Frankia sp. AgB32]
MKLSKLAGKTKDKKSSQVRPGRFITRPGDVTVTKPASKAH